MPLSERLKLAWLTLWAIALSWVCLLTYFRPEQNKLTLFGCMAFAGAILMIFGIETPAG